MLPTAAFVPAAPRRAAAFVSLVNPPGDLSATHVHAEVLRDTEAAAQPDLHELERFNEWLRTEMGFEKSFRMGIGLNTGRVTSVNVGSLKRMAYTTIGDTTNRRRAWRG